MDTADHVWIDHNTFQKINDGMIDSRKGTSHLTVSWNKLGGHNKTFGIGWTDNLTARITVHHNWIYDSNQRNPSVDNVALAHLYDNYLQNITSYGNNARGKTKMVVENSYPRPGEGPVLRRGQHRVGESERQHLRKLHR
jgi:pectate lyase